MNKKIIREAMLVAWEYEHGLSETRTSVEFLPPYDLSYEQAVERVEEESDQLKISEQEIARIKKQARHENIRFWRLVAGVILSIAAYIVGFLPWPLCVVAITAVVVINLIDMEG